MSDEIKGSVGPDNIFRLEPESRARLLAEQSERTRELDDKHFFETCEDNGYYNVSKEGKKLVTQPNYGALLKRFDAYHPHKTIADMKCVYVFNGTHYDDFTPIEIKAFSESKLKPEPKEAFRNEFFNKVMATNVVRRQFFVDSTKGKINFQNGVFHVDRMIGIDADALELSKHSPRFGFRYVLPYSYDPKAQCPVFSAWLKDVMFDDQPLMDILQEFAGYIVRGGDYKHHKALWLAGGGRNGKSTFLDVIKALIGDGNYSVVSLKDIQENRFKTAQLDGKLANFSEETGPKDLEETGKFKDLTGGGELDAEKKYGDPYKFRNFAKEVMTFNNMPVIKDMSVGLLSRLLIIPWKKDLEDEALQDKKLKDKLEAELPGIFNWAIMGWERLDRQGAFTVSEQSKEELEALKLESSDVAQWFAECVRFAGEGEYTPAYRSAELHAPYRAWCKDSDKYPKQLRQFEIFLSAVKDFRSHKHKNGDGNVEYRGLVITQKNHQSRF